ncbi:MAG: hypothetical protein WKF90_16385 [Pyrinomonadaceae bacterium]
MKIYKTIFIGLCALFFINCDSAPAPQSGGPTEILNAFYEAAKTKDIETMKRALSKGTMSKIEQSAQEQNTDVDTLLRSEDGTLVRQLPETRNEKIEGDTATLEVKNIETGEFEEVPFVIEGGAWRLALDQIIDEINEDETNEPAVENAIDANNSNSGVDAPSGDASNKPEVNKNQ